MVHKHRSQRYAGVWITGEQQVGKGPAERAAGNVAQARVQLSCQSWETDYANVLLAALSEFHSGRLLWAWLFLDEQLRLQHVIGLALATAGILMMQLHPFKVARE